MANANTNLMSLNPIRPTSSTNSTSRTKPTNFSRERPAVKKYQSSEKSSQSQKNFGAELDKANAQVNQSQQNNGEVQQVTEKVEGEKPAEVVTASTQGQSKNKQDAPQEQNQNLSAENSQPAAEKILDTAATEIVLNQPTATIDIPVDAAQNLTPTVDAENVDVEINPQNLFVDVEESVTAAIPADIPKAAVNAAENLSSTIPVDLNEEVPIIKPENPVEVVDETALATSADTAFYFTSTPETLLTAKIPDADVDTQNLMSIMPQARDDKAQSMLNFLSGRTWQSPNQNAETPTLQTAEQTQEISPQLQQSVTSALPIQPQFQSRQLNFKSINQAQVQNQLQTTPIDGQALNQVQPTLQAQVQSPLMTNQTVQAQVDAPTIQTPLNQNVQVQSQVPLNQIFTPQVDAPIQAPLTNQPTSRFEIPIQPTLTSQPLQTQVDIPIQAPLPNQQSAAQVQMPLTNQPLQVPIQTPFTNQQSAVQVQMPLTTDAPQVDVPIQSTLPNQPLQAPVQVQAPLTQAEPQVQQQQFGEEIQPQVNAFQAQIDTKTVNRQTVNELFGVEMQVEDKTVTPLTPLQSMSRQFNQNQQSMQNFGQFAQMNSEVERQATEQSTAGNENFTANFAPVNNTTQSQPTAQVQAPEMTQAPREDFNVPAQIVEQARMIRTAGNTEMVINLKPEHLGQLTLRVSVSTNGAVTASFYTDNAQVRAIIENTMVQLKQELNEQGIKVDNVEVYAGLNEDSLLNGQGQQAWQQNQNQRNRRGQIDMNVVEEELDALNPVTDNSSTDGVDYKV